MARNARYSDDEIVRAVADSFSIAGVMRRLSIKPAGGSHFHISKRIKAMGLDTSHFTGQGHNRGKRQPRKPANEILIALAPGSGRQRPHMLRRALLEIGRDYQCSSCGIRDWQERPITLEVDHIDGHAGDSRESNLRFLCPNCHSQTPNYCRKISSRPQPDYIQERML